MSLASADHLHRAGSIHETPQPLEVGEQKRRLLVGRDPSGQANREGSWVKTYVGAPGNLVEEAGLRFPVGNGHVLEGIVTA